MAELDLYNKFDLKLVGSPRELRLLKKKNGEIVLQGLMEWLNIRYSSVRGFVWADLPIVEEGEETTPDDMARRTTAIVHGIEIHM